MTISGSFTMQGTMKMQSLKIKSNQIDIFWDSPMCVMMQHDATSYTSGLQSTVSMMRNDVTPCRPQVIHHDVSCCRLLHTGTFYILVDVTTSQHLLSADSGWLTPECECQSAMKSRGTHLLKELSSSSEKFSDIVKHCPAPISLR